ncbi:hypothetical protein ACOME3_010033 [Neoechinorhynchus agilis]
MPLPALTTASSRPVPSNNAEGDTVTESTTHSSSTEVAAAASTSQSQHEQPPFQAQQQQQPEQQRRPENTTNNLTAAQEPSTSQNSTQPMALQSQQVSSDSHVPSSLYSLTSLYVGDLSPEATEAALFEKFSTAGPIISIRVCRDLMTRRSLGYAYVNFQHQPDAERALETMNYDILFNRPMRIMWSQRDPSLRKSGVGNIFIKNLDKSIDAKTLYDTFSVFGYILSCKIMYDDRRVSRGFGFVHYENADAAESAIVSVNGMLIKEKKVYVNHFMPKHQRMREMGGRSPKFTNIYVKNFADLLDDESLAAMFRPYGNIESAKVMRTETGQSRGFGFVSFDKPESAEHAVKTLNGTRVGSRDIYVGRAQKKAERMQELREKMEEVRAERMTKYQGVNLYIKNLDDSVDDQKLNEKFAVFGRITSAKVMKDESGNSRGFGFVCFTQPDEATRAVTEMNGRILGTKPLYVALAQRKEERRQHLQHQLWQRMSTLRGTLTQPIGQPPVIIGQPGAAPHPSMFAPGSPYGGTITQNAAAYLSGYPGTAGGPQAPPNQGGPPQVPSSVSTQAAAAAAMAAAAAAAHVASHQPTVHNPQVAPSHHHHQQQQQHPNAMYHHHHHHPPPPPPNPIQHQQSASAAAAAAAQQASFQQMAAVVAAQQQPARYPTIYNMQNAVGSSQISAAMNSTNRALLFPSMRNPYLNNPNAVHGGGFNHQAVHTRNRMDGSTMGVNSGVPGGRGGGGGGGAPGNVHQASLRALRLANRLQHHHHQQQQQQQQQQQPLRFGPRQPIHPTQHTQLPLIHPSINRPTGPPLTRRPNPLDHVQAPSHQPNVITLSLDSQRIIAPTNTPVASGSVSRQQTPPCRADESRSMDNRHDHLPPLPALPFTIDELKKASQERRKKRVGDYLHNYIKQINEQAAGRVTGMLLCLEEDALYTALQSPEEILNKIEEALTVIERRTDASSPQSSQQPQQEQQQNNDEQQQQQDGTIEPAATSMSS